MADPGPATAIAALTASAIAPALRLRRPSPIADAAQRRRWRDEKDLIAFPLWHDDPVHPEIDPFLETPFPFPFPFAEAYAAVVWQEVAPGVAASFVDRGRLIHEARRRPGPRTPRMSACSSSWMAAMPERPIRTEVGWDRGRDGHERAQRRREATMTMIEKLAWLEAASQVAAHLRRRVRVPPPPWARGVRAERSASAGARHALRLCPARRPVMMPRVAVTFPFRDEAHRLGSGTAEIVVAPDSCPALARHGIQLTGRSEAHRGFRFVRHAPCMSQVLGCLRGEGRAWVDGGWRRIGAGQALATPMRVAHAYEAVGRMPWVVGWVTWSGPTVPFAGPRLLAVDPRSLLAAIDGLHRATRAGGDPVLPALWADVLQREAVLPLGAARAPSRLAHLWEAVDAEPSAAWDITALARRAGIGPEQLRRLCLREVGRSPMRQVAQIRLERAAALLAGTPLSIAAIAGRVGYDSAFSFSTAFRRWRGATPSAWRDVQGGADGVPPGGSG